MTNRPLPDLCVVGGLQLDAPGGHTSKRMAEAWHEAGGRVLYAEIPARSFLAQNVRSVKDGFWRCDLSPAWKLPRTWPDCWRRWQVRRSSRRLEKALHICGFHQCETVFLYYGWFWKELVEALSGVHIYDCVDDAAAFPHIMNHTWMQRAVVTGERQMVAAADAVLAVSPGLVERYQNIANRIELLPNGVSFARWSSGTDATPFPEALSALPRPRAVLFGNMQPKLDYALVATLASRMPEMGFALIGPLMSGVTLPPQGRNLSWHDGIPQATLVAWMSEMDVGMVPLVDHPLNQASCPLKVLEYVSAGLPVVASRIPMTVYWQERFPDRIFLATTPGEWQAALQKACTLKRRALTFEEAASCSWTCRVQKLRELVDAVHHTKVPEC